MFLDCHDWWYAIVPPEWRPGMSKHLTMQSTVPATDNYLTPNVNSMEVKKPLVSILRVAWMEAKGHMMVLQFAYGLFTLKLMLKLHPRCEVLRMKS